MGPLFFVLKINRVEKRGRRERRGGRRRCDVRGRIYEEARAEERTELSVLNTGPRRYIRAINKSRKRGLCCVSFSQSV